MASSFLASFVIFVIIGCVVMEQLTVREGIGKWIVMVAMVSNGVFFFYFAAMAEMEQTTVNRLRTVTRFEWVLRVVNQSVLFSLWFFLQYGWEAFGVALVVLYCGYLLWDCVTWNASKDRWLFTFDLVGIILAGIFAMEAYRYNRHDAEMSMEEAIGFGIVATLYVVIAFVAVGVGYSRSKFNPIGKRWLMRDRMR